MKNLRIITFLLLTVFLFSASLLAQTTEEKQEVKGARITGILIENQKSLEGIPVHLNKVPFTTADMKNKKKRKKIFKKAVFFPRAMEVETDKEGQFVFEGVPVGNYCLTTHIKIRNSFAIMDHFIKYENRLVVIEVKDGEEVFTFKINVGDELKSESE